MENPYEVLSRRFDNVENLLADLISKQAPKQEKLHTVKSLADFAGVSELTIRNWIIEGRIEAKKIGGVIRIHESQFLGGLEDVKSLKHKR